MWTLILCLFLKLFKLTTATHEVTSITFTTNSHTDAASPGTITATLWFNFTIYQYSVNRPRSDTAYTAYLHSSPLFTIIGLTECPMHTSNIDSEAMIMLENDSSNGVYVESVHFETQSDAWYGIEQYCISSPAPSGFKSFWQIDDSVCGSGKDHYEVFCVDTEAGDCLPAKQMLAFDLLSPNAYSTTTQWNDATDVSIVTQTCSPTQNPTINPTSDPSESPSFHPTQVPSNNPTYSPQTAADGPQDIFMSSTSSPTTAKKKAEDKSNTDSVQKQTTIWIVITCVLVLCCCGCICIVVGCVLLAFKKEAKEIVSQVLSSTEGGMISGSSPIEGNIANVEMVEVPGSSKMQMIEVEATSNVDHDLRYWLQNTVQLPQYMDTFLQNGYDHLRMVQVIKNAEQLQAIGINLVEHQTRLLCEIESLRLNENMKEGPETPVLQTPGMNDNEVFNKQGEGE